MPGKKIREVDQKKIDPKFICCACTLLLDEPKQTLCGHLICSSCLELLFSKERPACPVDGTELKKEEVFPDGYTKRELRALNLYCPNVECKWHGTYDELEAHSGVCDYVFIKCAHSQCKEQIQRSHLAEHLNSECEYREVKCKYCGTNTAFASIKEHVHTSCKATPVICRHCKTNVLRKDIKEHEENLCDEVPGVCEFQAVGCKHHKVLKRKELRQHSNDGLIHHVQLLLQFVLTFVAQLKDYIPRVEFSGMIQIIREEVGEVRTTLTEKFVTLVGNITGLERRMEVLESTGGADKRKIKTEFQELKTKLTELNTIITSLREDNMALNRVLREKTSEIDRLRNRLDQNDESLALNTVKIAELESARGQTEVIHSYNGTLLWKIDGFQRKRQDAIGGITTAIYSPPFYSSQFGYKMCAKIYMNGDGFGRGSHLSLFFVVMKGEYDALQSWPFQKKITMMLMDQGNGDHMIDAFHSDPQSSSFQRPRSNMNIASGSPLFMPLDSLNNREYVKDDVMFIKIIVD